MLSLRSGIPIRSHFLGCPGPFQDPIIILSLGDLGEFRSVFWCVFALSWCSFSHVFWQLVCAWAGGVPRVAHRIIPGFLLQIVSRTAIYTAFGRGFHGFDTNSNAFPIGFKLISDRNMVVRIAAENSRLDCIFRARALCYDFT